jgi:MYXO-CTERM domain-containing protein
VFRAAPAIVGGREQRDAAGRLEERARPDSTNNFQGRYAIRHEWTGPLSCANPIRHRWGGPPAELAAQATGVKPALDLAFAPRGQIALPEVVQRDVPEIGIVAAAAKVVAAPVEVTPHPPTPSTAPATAKKSGCGCDTSTGDPGVIVLMLGTLLVWRRRTQ